MPQTTVHKRRKRGRPRHGENSRGKCYWLPEELIESVAKYAAERGLSESAAAAALLDSALYQSRRRKPR